MTKIIYGAFLCLSVIACIFLWINYDKYTRKIESLTIVSRDKFEVISKEEFQSMKQTLKCLNDRELNQAEIFQRNNEEMLRNRMAVSEMQEELHKKKLELEKVCDKNFELRKEILELRQRLADQPLDASKKQSD